MFEQPYPYHAGFSDQGFLYNDAGDLTLVWSSFDPEYEMIVGSRHSPLGLTAEEQTKLESLLLPAPRGGRWRFANPARCKQCSEEISAPMMRNIYYLVFEGSVLTDTTPDAIGFKFALVGTA
jgi:hypothetical protein